MFKFAVCLLLPKKFYTSSGYCVLSFLYNFQFSAAELLSKFLVTGKRTDFRENAIIREGQTDCLWYSKAPPVTVG